ncbi:hypothetical protein QE152_g24437 [Popillia japonica]|uniref:Uncharacterized protein n=1 Tax=Popillia japonica TaxID=7064 RepID=A0AAW1KFT4_POPJA
MAELNKIKKNATGSGTQDIYTPVWWCFELLTFLRNANATQKSIHSISSIDCPQANCNDVQNQETLILSEEDDTESNELLFERTIQDVNATGAVPLVSEIPTTSRSLLAKKFVWNDGETTQLGMRSYTQQQLFKIWSPQQLHSQYRMIPQENSVNCLK